MSDPEPPAAAPTTEPEAAVPEASASRAAHWAALVGSAEWVDAFRTPKVRVPRDRWVEAHRTLQPHLPFFSWLSAIDWSNEVAVGDPVEGDPVEERYEVISRLSDVSAGEAVMLSTDLPPDDLTVESLAGVYPAADWHEREAADMFGIAFTGHPNPVRIYLSEGFVGHPLRKSYPLLSREVKPWPGAVEVTPLPAAEGSAGEPKEGGA